MNLNLIVNHIQSGGLLAYPTETVWGLGVDIHNSQAIKNLLNLKGREASKGLSILVGNIYEARKFAEFDLFAEQLAEIFWPGPVTFVLKAKPTVPMEITGGSSFVGLRCSSHPFVEQLLRELKSPITSTSANKSGKPAAQNAEALLDWLPREVLKVHWPEERRGFESLGSTVIKIEKQTVSLLRSGDVDFQLIQAQVQKLIASCSGSQSQDLR